MVDLIYLAFQLVPIAYIIGYVYMFFTYIIPVFNVALTELAKVTILQLILGFFFFFPGLFLLFLCITFVVAMWTQ